MVGKHTTDTLTVDELYYTEFLLSSVNVDNLLQCPDFPTVVYYAGRDLHPRIGDL